MLIDVSLLAAVSAGTVTFRIDPHCPSVPIRILRRDVREFMPHDHRPSLFSTGESPAKQSDYTIEELLEGVLEPKKAWAFISRKKSTFYALQEKGNKRFDPTFPAAVRPASGRPLYPRVALAKWLLSNPATKRQGGG